MTVSGYKSENFSVLEKNVEDIKFRKSVMKTVNHHSQSPQIPVVPLNMTVITSPQSLFNFFPNHASDV